MIIRRHLAALLLPLPALALAACDEARAPEPTGEAAPAPAETTGEAQADGSTPGLDPAALEGEAERGEKGARNVLIAFMRAIELKAFHHAYALLREDARQGMTEAQFAAQFDGFGTITLAAPDGTMEGAAGTSYYTAPVTITGSNGQELTGEIVLSRVNDVPGATPEQLRWRVRSFDIAD